MARATKKPKSKKPSASAPSRRATATTKSATPPPDPDEREPSPSDPKTERLLNLIALLLNAPAPITLEQIKQDLKPAYDASNPESARRMFMRDKAELIELGIPMRSARGRDGEDAYAIERRDFHLPDLQLDAEERGAAALAATAAASTRAFPWQDDLERALQKLTLGEPSAAAPAGVLVRHPVARSGFVHSFLGQLDEAMVRRKKVTLRYRSWRTGELEVRVTDPYGLHCSRGRWYLVGHSHERNAIRVFALHRIEEIEVNGKQPGAPDFEVPAGFRIADYARRKVWDYARHDPLSVEVDVREDFAWLAERFFGRSLAPANAGWQRLSLSVTNAEAVVDWALEMGTKVRVVSPDLVRDKIRERLEAILARHGAKAP